MGDAAKVLKRWWPIQGRAEAARWTRRAVVGVVCSAIAVGAFYAGQIYESHGTDLRVIATACESKPGGPSYVARVSVERAPKGRVAVNAKVHLAAPGDKTSWLHYVDDIGTLAVEANMQDAIAKWGKVEWTTEGVWFGAGMPNAVLVARSRVENHR